MKDAWIIWIIIKGSVESKSKKSLKLQNIYNRFEQELRFLFHDPKSEGSPGMLLVKRLYKSWEQKSMHADFINEKVKNKEIDQMGAYVMVIFQTLMATMPHSRNFEEFHAEREKDVDEFFKIIDEWKKFVEMHKGLKN